MPRPSKTLYVVYHFTLCAHKSYVYWRLAHLTGVFKKHTEKQCWELSDLIRRIYQIIFVRFFSFAKGQQN